MKDCPNFFQMSFGQTLEMLRLCKGPGPGGKKHFQTPKQRVDREFERGEIILVPESSIPYSAGGFYAPEGYFDDMDDESLSFANSTEPALTFQVLMIPKRQDVGKSTEEQEQEETKDGKTHTADKAKKCEIEKRLESPHGSHREERRNAH
jgi:hypothetical protein